MAVSSAPNTALATSAALPSAACAPTAVTTGIPNFRTGPGLNYTILTSVPANVQMPVTGRNADASWWQTVFNGQQGWVNADFVRTDCVGGVPVVSASTTPTTPPPARPPSGGEVFTANPTTINFGSCTILSWNAPNATRVTLNFGAQQVVEPQSGTRQVCPTKSSRFYLRATNANGQTDVLPVDITVVGNPNNPANFRSNSYIVNPGECPTLYWNIDNVNAVLFAVGNGPEEPVDRNGSRQVCVSTPTNYRLNVVGTDGQPRQSVLTINTTNAAPGNVQLSVHPTSVNPGGCVEVHWLAGNARQIQFLDSGANSQVTVGPFGNINVCPSRTSTYTVKVTRGDGSVVQQSQTVTVASN